MELLLLQRQKLTTPLVLNVVKGIPKTFNRVGGTLTIKSLSMKRYFVGLVAVVIAVAAFAFTTVKDSQTPCDRTDLKWFVVKTATVTNDINIAKANLDFTVTVFTGDRSGAISQFGCPDVTNYCALAYAPADLDAQGHPKPGATPLCTIKRLQ